MEKTLESSLDIKGCRRPWESTEVEIGWDMEEEVLGIGVFSMADVDVELRRRFGAEEAEERL